MAGCDRNLETPNIKPGGRALHRMRPRGCEIDRCRPASLEITCDADAQSHQSEAMKKACARRGFRTDRKLANGRGICEGIIILYVRYRALGGGFMQNELILEFPTKSMTSGFRAAAIPPRKHFLVFYCLLRSFRKIPCSCPCSEGISESRSGLRARFGRTLEAR